MFKKMAVSTALALGVAMGGSAQAVTIDFDAFTSTGAFSGVLFEDGYTLSFSDMFIDASGGASSQPTEIERLCCTGSGTLTITKTGGGSFTFNSIDWQYEYGTPPVSVTVTGMLGGPAVGSDTYSTSSGAYATFAAGNLAGDAIDTLVIFAQRDLNGGGSFDNIVLSAAAVPAPAPVALIGLGLLGLGALRRRWA